MSKPFRLAHDEWWHIRLTKKEKAMLNFVTMETGQDKSNLGRALLREKYKAVFRNKRC